MQYSPKLKGAMEEIKQILKKHDIGGVIVLHTPGHSEHFVKIDPTYSCARYEGDNGVRIRARLNEDFKGDRVALEQTMSDTSNMLHLLSKVNAGITLDLINISEMVDKALNAHHYPGDHTSNQSQNN